ncbi:cytochrome bd-I oxidase subunit CydX [Luteimonas deserti]|uniref:Cytochrome bd-I oxidase subunit CydX n=1 Tax=Luteimonas deserti TaxID=2752306 RepID=A0A7Z0QV12_9GAMM|nr:cytochrome bd-I oxidase subunit CydX [Luteimonas deserti]NYZ63888.1 cytochrome bd-I oxidase subunit CydX [Luteimonas deserti]
MWYFAWILGIGLAACFAILNGMWFEVREQRREAEGTGAPDAAPALTARLM